MIFFNKNMSFLRKSLNLSQAEICRQIGFKPTTWNNYELGRSNPNLEDFYKIIKFFGVDGLKILDEDLSKGKVIQISEIHKNSKKDNVLGHQINDDAQKQTDFNMVAQPMASYNQIPYDELIKKVMSLEKVLHRLTEVVNDKLKSVKQN